MKKLFAILVSAIILLALFTGCSKQDTASDAAQELLAFLSESTKDTGPVESNKYYVLSMVDYKGDASTMGNFSFDNVILPNDLNEANSLMQNVGQTAFFIKERKDFSYEAVMDRINISANNDVDLVELSILQEENVNESFNGAIAVQNVNYSGHEGTIYKSHAGFGLYVYIGKTQSTTCLVAIGNKLTTLRDILSDIVAVQSDVTPQKNFNEYRASIGEADFTTMVGNMLFVHMTDVNDYEIEATSDGIYAVTDDREFYTIVSIGDPLDVADLINQYIQDENLKSVRYTNVENIFGFLFTMNNDDKIFCGFDKDTYAAVTIESDLTDELMQNFIQSTNVIKAEITSETMDEIQCSVAQRDESFVNELVSAIESALSKEDCFKSILPYSCDGNVSSYVDIFPVETANEYKIYIDCEHDIRHYYFSDELRQKSGAYSVDGITKGITITFNPVEDIDGNVYYYFKDGIINQFVRPDSTTQGRTDIEVKYDGEIPDYENQGTLGTMHNTAICDYITSILGPRLQVLSDKYKDFPLTVFVEMDERFLYYIDAQFAGANE